MLTLGILAWGFHHSLFVTYMETPLFGLFGIFQKFFCSYTCDLPCMRSHYSYLLIHREDAEILLFCQTMVFLVSLHDEVSQHAPFFSIVGLDCVRISVGVGG